MACKPGGRVHPGIVPCTPTVLEGCYFALHVGCVRKYSVRIPGNCAPDCSAKIKLLVPDAFSPPCSGDSVFARPISPGNVGIWIYIKKRLTIRKRLQNICSCYKCMHIPCGFSVYCH